MMWLNKSSLMIHRYVRRPASHHLFFINLLGSLVLPPTVYAAEKQFLTEMTVTSMLRRYVQQQGPWQPEQVELTLRNFTPVPLPTGTLDMQILRPRHGVVPGIQSFQLRMTIDGKQVKTMWVRAEVQIFAEVMVTSRPLAFQETITPEAVRRERREVGSLYARPFTRLEEVIDRQAIRHLHANQILTPAHVQLPQAVRPGSPVTLVYDNARLRVEVPGLAVEAGKVGAVVRVKNLSSGQLLEGQLIDARMVMIR
jgi:flagella basal body P-ring formation protein FlgA